MRKFKFSASIYQKWWPSRPSKAGAGAFSGSFADPSRNIDWILLASVAALSVIGMFNTFSATRQRLLNQGFDPFIYVQRQVAFTIVAVAMMVGASILADGCSLACVGTQAWEIARIVDRIDSDSRLRIRRASRGSVFGGPETPSRPARRGRR